MKPSVVLETKSSSNDKTARKAKSASRPENAAVSSANAAAAALEARRAEIRWLTQQHGERMRALLQDNEALRQRIKTLVVAAEAAEAIAGQTGGIRETQVLKAEITHLTAANERYLARIYELKAQIAAIEKF